MAYDFKTEREAVTFFRYLCLCAAADDQFDGDFHASRSSAWGSPARWTVEVSGATADWSDAVLQDFENLQDDHHRPRQERTMQKASRHRELLNARASNAIYQAGYAYACGYHD